MILEGLFLVLDFANSIPGTDDITRAKWKCNQSVCRMSNKITIREQTSPRPERCLATAITGIRDSLVHDVLGKDR